VPAVAALLIYFWAALGGSEHGARWSLAAAWVAHGTALLAHVLGVGEVEPGARFGFAPALCATAWLVVAVYAIESRFVPLVNVRRVLAVMGGLSLGLMLVFPGEPHLHPGAPWAPLHWLLGLASYGLFGAAVLHASLLDRAERALRQRGAAGASAALPGIPLLKLEALTFRFVSSGFMVLTAAIVMGALFAGAWRWDHKTVFSLLGWLVFAGLLLGRRTFGWRGRQAIRWLYAGSLLLLLAYVGSRFVFEVLLQRSPGA
jgi:ABC-type uncharacterized transport system permease subunit